MELKIPFFEGQLSSHFAARNLFLSSFSCPRILHFHRIYNIFHCLKIIAIANFTIVML